MTYSKINSTDMRQNNYRAVLDTIRFSDGISRKAISGKIGLTGATISNIVSDLVRLGYVRETGLAESTSGGRREILLSLNPDICYAVGVELSASTINCVLTDFAASIRARQVTKIRAILEDRQAIFRAIADTVETVIAESGVAREKVRGIGLCTPGPCDVEKGVVINPPNLQCLRDVPIREIISEMTGFPVFFEHHMNAAALCEQWLGQAHNSRCMFLCGALEIGVGSGMIVDGRLHRGNHDAAGEIGHMSIDPNGPKCVCGNYGCLEPLAEGRALLNGVRKKLAASPELCAEYGISDPEEIDMDTVLERAEKGEPLFRDELLLRAGYLAQALGSIISVLSPDTIVLMGEMADKSPLYVKTIMDYVHGRSYPAHVKSITIYATPFKRFISALGGATMVLNSVYGDL